MSERSDYFSRDPMKWRIIEFLSKSELEPFEAKVDSYIKKLNQIISCDCEQDDRKKRAQLLLDRYQKASKNLFSFRV